MEALHPDQVRASGIRRGPQKTACILVCCLRWTTPPQGATSSHSEEIVKGKSLR